MGQLALTLVVLATAGLSLRSLRRALNVGAGLDVQHLMILRFRSDQGASNLEPEYRQLREHLKTVPAIEQASLSLNAPFRTRWYQRVIPEGREGATQPQFGVDFLNEQIQSVTPRGFRRCSVASLATSIRASRELPTRGASRRGQQGTAAQRAFHHGVEAPACRHRVHSVCGRKSSRLRDGGIPKSAMP